MEAGAPSKEEEESQGESQEGWTPVEADSCEMMETQTLLQSRQAQRSPRHLLTETKGSPCFQWVLGSNSSRTGCRPQKAFSVHWREVGASEQLTTFSRFKPKKDDWARGHESQTTVILVTRGQEVARKLVARKCYCVSKRGRRISETWLQFSVESFLPPSFPFLILF